MAALCTLTRLAHSHHHVDCFSQTLKECAGAIAPAVDAGERWRAARWLVELNIIRKHVQNSRIP